jgi:hypothetical protein
MSACFQFTRVGRGPAGSLVEEEGRSCLRGVHIRCRLNVRGFGARRRADASPKRPLACWRPRRQVTVLRTKQYVTERRPNI